MRLIPTKMNKVLHSNYQVKEDETQLLSIVEVKRPETVLTNDMFLERIKLNLGNAIITDTDIAVSRPLAGHPNEDVYIAAVVNGRLRVYHSETYYIMEKHQFIDIGLDDDAKSVTIGFETELVETPRYTLERETKKTPWVFYTTSSGKLKGKKIGGTDEVVLTESNATDVSCVSGPWHSSSDFDYGMMVFYIVNEMIMCRRLIKGVWYKSQTISFGPGAPYKSVAATLTWDYRVAITVSKTDNSKYVIFTNFLGFGKFAGETVPVSKIETELTVYKNTRHTSSNRETIFAKIGTKLSPIRKGPATVVRADNVRDHANNFGRFIDVTFTTGIGEAAALHNNGRFELSDSDGNTTWNIGTSISPQGNLRLEFVNFNDYVGELTIRYNPGAIYNEFWYSIAPFTVSFTPNNLDGRPDLSYDERIRAISVTNLNVKKLVSQVSNSRETVATKISTGLSLIHISDI